jgi:hypothetical protein
MRAKIIKNIHDKFNTAIRVDQNWGKSSKVALDIVSHVKKNKNADINYRRIRSFSKTPNLSVSEIQQRTRMPRHNKVVGMNFGFSRRISEVNFGVIII